MIKLLPAITLPHLLRVCAIIVFSLFTQALLANTSHFSNNYLELSNSIDLELSLNINPTDPNIFENTTITVTINNTGAAMASGVMVSFPKPAGIVYAGGNEWSASQGTFVPFGNEMWNVGSLAAGGTATLQLNYFMLTDAPITLYGQVSAANEADADSTPGNGSSPTASEDDEVVGSINGSPAVSCPGDIELTSQAAVNAWAGCTIVEGNLTISGSDITNLSPLSTLEKVRGALIVDANTTLASISGLEGLDSVGVLIFTNNPQLTSIAALNLSQTQIVSIILENNDNLQSISGLNNFTRSDFLSIKSNDNLTSVTGFNGLTSLGGLLNIESNSALSNLSGFSNLVAIEQNNFQLIGNNSLPTISGFSNLSTVQGIFIISTNDVLENLNNFSSLANAQSLVVVGNATLSDCCGLYPILNDGGITGGITINGNPMFCGSAQEILDNCEPPSGSIDLALSMNQPNPTPNQWSNYQVDLTINNTGGQTATGVEVSFPKPTGVVYNGGTQFTTSQGNFNPFADEVWNVGTIQAGGSATLTVNYFLLVAESPVAWAEVIAANEPDADSTPGNGISPNVNEDDEASTGGGGPPVLTPDLTLSNLDLSNIALEAGQVLNYQFDISNIGNGAADGSFNVKAWISTDQTISLDDIQDGIVQTGNFGAGLTQADVSGASSIPGGLADGQYYLILRVDADDAIAESNEGNNEISSLFTVFSEEPTTACSFTTYYTDANLDPLDGEREVTLQETAGGYTLIQNNDFSNTQFPPTEFDTYALDLNGNVLESFQSTFEVIYEVDLEVDDNNNLSMVFVQSPDVANGTVVPIDINYPNPVAVLTSTGAFKTANGYVFGIGIIDENINLINRVFQTDNFGQNVTFTDLTDADFFGGGFGRFVEGANGTLALAYQTSGNFSLFTIPGDGSPAWQARVATDTPSSTWVDLEVSQDGNFVYTMKVDNLQTFIAKYRVSDGLEVGINLVDLKTSVDPMGFRYTFPQGIEPTADGGLLVSLIADEISSLFPNFQVLAKYDAAGNLVWKTEIPDPEFQLYPAGATSDGGALFVGNSNGPSVFLKTAANGALMPECETSSCDFTIAATAGACNDNQTPNDTSDDYFLLTVDASADWSGETLPAPGFSFSGQSGSTTISVNIEEILPFTSNGQVSIRANATGQPGCFQDITIAIPNTCSEGTSGDPCDNVSITPSPGQVSITGVSTPLAIIKVFRPNWSLAYECTGNCPQSVVVDGLAAGPHFVEVKLLDANWNLICKVEQTATVPTSLFNNGQGTFALDNSSNGSELTDFVLFPNPAKQYVDIKLGTSVESKVNIHITNNLGQTVLTEQLNNSATSTHRLAIQSLPEGHYVLWLAIDGQQPMAKKFIIGK